MKVVKALAILCFFSILFGSCFTPPEFPAEPEIAFQDIVFKDIPDNSKPDSLILYLTFKDGDGDLGLDPQNPADLGEPYNPYLYFQTNAAGDYTPVKVVPAEVTFTGKNNQQTVEILDYLQVDDPTQGQLIFDRTRSNPLYSNLPELSCTDFQFRKFVINDGDVAVLHQYSQIDTTLVSGGVTYHVVEDTLYIQSNPNHYNIEVDFFVKEGGSFVEYDWRKEFCSTFDGRFPILSDNNDTALDGTLKYNMESRGFKLIFGAKTLKLRIQIKDRALHLSNVIETGEFTLESIRK
jgi:hypothetical protein